MKIWHVMGKSVKSREERLQIKADILKQLDALHIDVEVVESLQPFLKLLEEYCMPKIVSGYSGRMAVPELGRVLEYVLPLRVWAQPMVRMVKAPT